MAIDLKISQKGFLLVCVPLIFEIVFVSILFGLLQQTEAEVKRETKARRITTQTNIVVRGMLDFMVGAAGYGVLRTTKFEGQYNDAIDHLPRDFQQLENLLKDQPEKQKNVHTLGVNFDRGVRMANDARIKIENGEIPAALQMLPKLQTMSIDASKRLYNLVKEERDVENESPQIQARLREQTNFFLLFFIVFNVAISLALAYYFSSSITKRLRRINENSTKLALEQPLNPPVGGKDEIADLDRSFHHMAEIVADATNRERALATRFGSIIENIPIGLAVCTKTGIVETANPALDAMFMVTASGRTIIGKSLSTLFSSDDRFELNPETLLGQTVSCVAIKSNGEKFPAEIACHHYESHEGNRFMIMITDETQKEEVERLKQEFVMILSHELRSPLTSLKLLLEILNEGLYGQLNEQGLKKIAVAERNITRLVKMIQELLDLETIDSGNLSIDLKPVEVRSALEKAIEACRGPASVRKVELEMEAQELNVMSDEDRLIQVVINLVSNAVKFSDEGTSVKVVAEASGTMVRFSVIDKGPGIPEEHRQRIFERFNQVDKKESGKKGGVGLGLAICKSIIDRHGGTIGVDSETGKGSTFWFTIPLVK